MTLFPRNVFEESLTVEWAWASYADRGRKTKTKSAERHVKTSPRHETVKMARISPKVNFMSIDLSCCHLIWKEAERDVKSSNCSIFYENNVCYGLKVKPGTSYSKLSVNLLEAAASYYQLVTEDWLWGNGLLAILHDCNLNFSQNFFTPLQVFSFVSLSLDKMKHNLYSCYSGNILSPKIHLSSNDKWVNGRINSTQRSNREPLEARLSHCPSLVITGDFLL